MSKRYKIGLVLSGGAARGLAHAGVLQALHEEGLFPDVISGVSAGAIIGAFYGDGYKPLELLDLFLEKSMLSFVKPTLPKQGLFRMSGLEEVLEEHLVARTFSDLKIPLFITATDFQAGKSVYFSEGLLIPRIIASSSIPVLFVPVFINGKMYVDGGLLDNLPLEPIQNQCELLIGVHVNPIGHADKPEGIMRIAERSFHMAIASQIENKIPLFDIFIEPLELRDYGLMDLKKAREMFGIGYHEARRVLAEYNRRKMHA
jgi:NTE family protein